MPRPQRKARFNAQRSSPHSSPKSSITPTKINAQLTGKAEGKRLTDSDDSDGLVTKGNGGRRGAFLRPQEVFASGAVAVKDKTNAHPTRAQRRKQMQDAMLSGSKSSKSPTPSNSKPPSAHASPKAALATISQNAATAPVARPTPAREDSILNGIRPRKRQNSILRSPGLDDSTIGESTLGSLLLPQDENSPLNLPKHKSVATTPASLLPSSASKKRKLGVDDTPATPAESARLTSSPPPEQREASLPPQPPSTIHISSQKRARRSINHDETDIMAPPMSSSSEHSSPPKPPVKETKKKSKPAPATLTTQQLQSQLMPTKRQKQLKSRTEFDIPSDTDSAAQLEEDDSTFLAPNKRKSTRRQKSTAAANTSKKLQPKSQQQRKISGSKKPQQKQNSTAPLLLTSSRSRSRLARTPAAATTAVAGSETSDADSAAKSPSQLSELSSSNVNVHAAASPPKQLRTTRGSRAAAAGKTAKAGERPSRTSRPKKAQGGGSPLKTSFGGGIGLDTNEDDDKENDVEAMSEGEVEVEIQVGRGGRGSGELDDDDPLSLPPLKQKKGKVKLGTKWQEIDDFEMDFEDVSLGSEGSSDSMAR